MARYQVILAYDGTDFFGFQRQAQASEIRTVQAVLERALQQIGWHGRSILAAGRTDTGVHACGQVVAFDLDWRHSCEALQAALNANLPLDVAAQSVKLARPDFHPRYDALARCYRYRIFCSALRDPLRERYAWRVWPAVDVDRLRQAAGYLPGRHDFSAFGAPTRPGGAALRNVFRAVWQEQELGLVFEIEANAFLYHMVRRLVSLQVAIGQGALEASAVLEHLEGRLSAPAPGLAPAQGLILVEVVYPALEREESESETRR
ncbi:MAG: tRNA pseudouridine(38-40) synthase TruA [Anaerolineales bacterium]|nr:tRNA pseudouridine(38-40) synthase TruA [Anaerolineales bacterium]